MTEALATTGFSREAVIALSRRKGEPEWMLQKRLEAWEIYEQTPAPLGRRGDLGTLQRLARFHFQELRPYLPADGDGALPTSIEEGLRDALVGANERSGLVLQRNSSVVRVELSEELKSRGVILTDLDTAVREHGDLVQRYFMSQAVPLATDKYTALHAAFWSGGVFLYIPSGVEIEEPILAQIWLDSPSAAAFAHTLVIADELSSARYVEEYASTFEGEQPSLLSAVVEVFTKNGARIEFTSLQDLGRNVWSVMHKNSIHEADSSVSWVMADLGSRLTFSNIGSNLIGNGSAAELVGVFFSDQDQRFVIKSLSNHVGLSTNAETLVHGALTDESRVEFDGMIRVQPGAQQTASFLSEHNLLLSKHCRAEAIPGLEIGANEVSASHGATTGQVDEEQLFYLMARGLPKDEAERIIVQGFFEPVLQRITLDSLRTRLRRNIVRRMRGGHESEADWIEAQERWEIEGVDEGAVSFDRPSEEEEIRLLPE
ncbi:Fe-S cluster assembly protein SufD [Thermogemmatispora onikobensis]|uniref:Fe-S cluster assembly protein SufD n=1 Tax=Thermogemmatispora onikobensis TaxID=732234 RepID=UPI000853BE2B|nr:Fe-S cluster assembly protein SufD [Thermogemmatispora onikobensis]